MPLVQRTVYITYDASRFEDLGAPVLRHQQQHFLHIQEARGQQTERGLLLKWWVEICQFLLIILIWFICVTVNQRWLSS